MTAVDLLIKELKDFGYYTYNLEKLCEQAKEMEKQKQDEFAIGFAEWCLKIKFEPIENVCVKKLLEIYKKENKL